MRIDMVGCQIVSGCSQDAIKFLLECQEHKRQWREAKCKDPHAWADHLYNRLFEIWGKALGPNHPKIVNELNNLACMYYKSGDYGKSSEIVSRTKEIEEIVFKAAPSKETTSLKVPVLEFPSPEEIAREEPVCELTLDELEALELRLVNNGHFDKAERVCKIAIEMSKRIFGAMSDRVLKNLISLANLHELQNNRAEALVTYTQAIEILDQRSSSQLEQKEYAAAELCLKQSLEMRAHLFGKMHFEVVKNLVSLADVYEMGTQHNLSFAIYERAVAILEHEALLRLRQKKYTDAQAFLRYSLAIRERVMAQEEEAIARNLMQLADVLYLQDNKNEEGARLYKRAINLFVTLARKYAGSKNHGKACECYKKAIQSMERVFGSDHVAVTIYLRPFAEQLRAQGEHEKADIIIKRIMAMRNLP
jgi:tetratricopeptide (TPR) repeat protein